MASGRKTGGRQKGTPNRRTRETMDAAKRTGVTPLDYMLQMLADESASKEDRMWAAEKAAPYVHPKLASVEHGVKDGAPLTFERIERIIVDPQHGRPESLSA